MAAHAPALLRLLLTGGLGPSASVAAAAPARGGAMPAGVSPFPPSAESLLRSSPSATTTTTASRVPLVLAALLALLLWGVGPVLVFAAEMQQHQQQPRRRCITYHAAGTQAAAEPTAVALAATAAAAAGTTTGSTLLTTPPTTSPRHAAAHHHPQPPVPRLPRPTPTLPLLSPSSQTPRHRHQHHQPLALEALSWPGLGVLFFWQLGVLEYLQTHFSDAASAALPAAAASTSPGGGGGGGGGVECSSHPHGSPLPQQLPSSRAPPAPPPPPLTVVGSSSGGFIAAFAACGVRPHAALRAAHRLLLEHRVMARPLGLAGLWGGLVRTWLHELLPVDAAERCNGGSGSSVAADGVGGVGSSIPGAESPPHASSAGGSQGGGGLVGSAAGGSSSSSSSHMSGSGWGASGSSSTPSGAARVRVRVVVTTWPCLHVRSLGNFRNKHDLIEVLAASAHIPYFMDWRPTAPCRGGRVLDGSTCHGDGGGGHGHGGAGAGASAGHGHGHSGGGGGVLVMDPRADGALRAHWSVAACLRALSLGGAEELMEAGAAWAAQLHAAGALTGLRLPAPVRGVGV
ncbi:hypothetical protein HYH02_006660 [Chlamydomonas schloesseri]|uniref:PNPLA domain-containing protein n=1 Tax=Chlamydomonas schloesseri TaxID=2026947 RepID=A0A835T573_9CHLO|nr:hypothetical protein HYH02_006660 [Chlamydomonas schloesseri]|eukprot:KAG2432675.1 hypothetical protein HYH02_006660 [Chlamydomonas schloesseri]